MAETLIFYWHKTKRDIASGFSGKYSNEAMLANQRSRWPEYSFEPQELTPSYVLNKISGTYEKYIT